MAQRALRIEGLPESALDAAAAFHSDWLPQARALLAAPGPGEDLVLIFPSALYDHRAWRLAAVQGLARTASPRRVNAVVGDGAPAVDETVAWLARSPGVTGQLLELAPG